MESSNQLISPRPSAGEYMNGNFTVYGSKLVDTGSGSFVLKNCRTKQDLEFQTFNTMKLNLH